MTLTQRMAELQSRLFRGGDRRPFHFLSAASSPPPPPLSVPLQTCHLPPHLRHASCQLRRPFHLRFAATSPSVACAPANVIRKTHPPRRCSLGLFRTHPPRMSERIEIKELGCCCAVTARFFFHFSGAAWSSSHTKGRRRVRPHYPESAHDTRLIELLLCAGARSLS